MLNSPTMMDATDLTVSVTVMAHTNVQRQKLSIFVTIQIPGDVDNVRSKVKHIEEIQDFHSLINLYCFLCTGVGYIIA